MHLVVDATHRNVAVDARMCIVLQACFTLHMLPLYSFGTYPDYSNDVLYAMIEMGCRGGEPLVQLWVPFAVTVGTAKQQQNPLSIVYVGD